MIIQPIPREVLPHTVTVTGEELDSWGNYITPDGVSPYELAPVRLDFGAELKINRAGQEITARGILFIDQTRCPDFTGLEVGSVISYAGSRYTVVVCDPVFADRGDRPHHYELGLI